MKRFGLIDLIIIIGVLAALIVGYCTVKHFRQTADKQIETTSPIVFQVFIRGVTVTGQEFPIKANEKAFITIRNVPYTELDVIEVSSQPRKILSPTAKSVLVNDPSQPNLYDAVVTIKDVAKITKDGAVVGGNKIKIGLPIILEGETYKFSGTLSDIRVQTQTQIDDSSESNNIG